MNSLLSLEGMRGGETFAPLARVTLRCEAEGTITIADALGRVYFRQPACPRLECTLAGALGYHAIVLEDEAGKMLDHLHIRVDASTSLQDEGGLFHELFQMLLYTMLTQGGADWGDSSFTRYNGRIYSFFIRWLRDHVHVLKGMKYFSDQVKDGIDLYRDSQRDDGLIWDNVYPRTEQPNYWDVRFADGDFIRPFPDYTAEFKRIPVEADVEYLFVEGLYYTWKATGDTGWLAASLDSAIRALDYSVSSPYRWSEKYQLIKRGYTIDTWDFQSTEDSVVNHDAMRVDPEKTHFGIMFGDNTGYIASCTYLAEMLDYVGRTDVAARFRERASAMRQRLDALAWNGHFYTHHVPEHPERKRDLGVDESQQVSLSNAYSLNRGLSHEQCVEIIRTYLRIKEQLPQGSPGEWYTIYPPFQKGFGDHNGIWQYMNGGVTPIVAGELAHGAFQHGYEDYAVDILSRLSALGKRHQGMFHSAYTGALPAPPARDFLPLDIRAYANTDVSGSASIARAAVPAWVGEGENDLHEFPAGSHVLAGVPFLIPDPASNQRRACIGLSERPGYAREVTIPVQRPASAIYFLHTTSKTGVAGIGGTITLHYEDGSTFTRYVVRGVNVSGWWFPEAPYDEHQKVTTAVVWRGKNAHCPDVGVIAYGLDNPHPALLIDRIVLTAAAEGAFWGVMGVTLSNQPVYFPPRPISFGIPAGWGAAAVMYALIEGLVGVVDQDVAYRRVSLSPRWVAAGVEQASALVKYPASQGYLAYRYRHDPQQGIIELTVTGSGEHCSCHLLLPPVARQVLSVEDDQGPLEFTTSRIEQSHYVDFTLKLPVPRLVKLRYA